MGAAHEHGTTYEIIDLVLPLEEFESVATYGSIGEYGFAAGYAGLGVVEVGGQLYGAHWLAKGARRVFVRAVARDVEEVFVTRVSGAAGKKGLVEYSAGPIAPGSDAASVAAGRGTYRLGHATSANYRGTFFKAHPELEGKVVVHHRVEQQVLTRYPGRFTKAEIHSLENLRGIPKLANPDLHLSGIRREWNAFYRQFRTHRVNSSCKRLARSTCCSVPNSRHQ